MKKYLLISIVLISILTRLNAQNNPIPYFENFENGLAGWSTSDNGQGTSWELGSPTIGFTQGAYSGSNCWDVNLNSGYQNNANCNLLSPVFDFTFASQVKISFFTHYRTEYLWDYLTVQYTVDNGDNWIFLPFPYLANPDGMTPKWIETSLFVNDLYGNPSVQFRFTFISDGSTIHDGYSIDDFRIESDPLSAPTLSSNDDLFTVYPNPSSGEVNINFTKSNSPNATITLFDIAGKAIFSKPVANSSGYNLQVSSLNKGSYTVVFSDADALIVKKLVVVQ
ncbi:MAG: T9SS type A sorting domain-containing protein [Bacteroidetes bacterium]|nr:T9SS type A sorting domain-containing protein [Bacteroidota bacterium]